MYFILLSVASLASITQLSSPLLVVNIKTRNGQLTQQQILADPEKDIVTLDFSYADGTRTTALIDFPKV